MYSVGNVSSPWKLIGYLFWSQARRGSLAGHPNDGLRADADRKEGGAKSDAEKANTAKRSFLANS